MVAFGCVVHMLGEDSRVLLNFWEEEKFGSQMSVFLIWKNVMPVYMFRKQYVINFFVSIN